MIRRLFKLFILPFIIAGISAFFGFLLIFCVALIIFSIVFPMDKEHMGMGVPDHLLIDLIFGVIGGFLIFIYTYKYIRRKNKNEGNS
jgi:hypothetical protein